MWGTFQPAAGEKNGGVLFNPPQAKKLGTFQPAAGENFLGTFHCSGTQVLILWARLGTVLILWARLGTCTVLIPLGPKLLGQRLCSRLWCTHVLILFSKKRLCSRLWCTHVLILFPKIRLCGTHPLVLISGTHLWYSTPVLYFGTLLRYSIERRRRKIFITL